MDLFPLVEIIFYIATLFAPIHATEIHACHSKSHVTYSKVATGWESSADGSIWRQDNTTIHHSNRSIDVSKYVKGAEDHNWHNQKSLELPGKIVVSKTAGGYLIYPNGTESPNDKWTISYKRRIPAKKTNELKVPVKKIKPSEKGYSGAHQNPNGTWVAGGNYPGAHQNPDGTWVLGGAYSGAHQNPDGTWVAGGAYSGAHQNPDGTWVAGGKYPNAHQNPDGTWVAGGAYSGAHQNPDGTWVAGGKYPNAHQNPDGTWVAGGDYPNAHQNPDGTWVAGGDYSNAHQNPDGTWVAGGAYSGAHQNPDGTWVAGGDDQQLSNEPPAAREPSEPLPSSRLKKLVPKPKGKLPRSFLQPKIQVEEKEATPAAQPNPVVQAKPVKKRPAAKLLKLKKPIGIGNITQ